MSAGGQSGSSPAEADGSERETGSAVRRFVEEAYDQVAGIGEGWRWYDLPYKALMWFSLSWRRRMLPRRVREWINYGINYLIPLNEHERNKIWSRDDPLRNISVPADEHVAMQAVWVVELFPPSEFDTLRSTIQRNSWDKRRRLLGNTDSNREMLENSRAGNGQAWWRLADIVSVDSGYSIPDGSREKLPAEFNTIELKAIQVGAGLTAVVALFQLTEQAAGNLDSVWHAPHEPQLIRGRGRPRAEDRMWSTFRITQEARRAVHDAARKWMAERCAGFFASNNEPQLLVDVLLFEKYDPIPGLHADWPFREALRALGLTEHEVLRRSSVSLPQMLLSPVEGQLSKALESKRTWALWGNQSVIAAASPNLHIYGSNTARAIVHAANEEMGQFLLTLAISDYLAVVEAMYAELRDGARTRHGTFKARGLRRLRSSFLSLSIDLVSVARDVEAFRQRKRNYLDEAQFKLDYAPWIIEADEKRGRQGPQPINLNKDLHKAQREWFTRLTAADRDYRDILSTVASLGASADAYKIGRVALLVAGASLVVALVTLLVTQTGDRTVIGGIVSWIRARFGL